MKLIVVAALAFIAGWFTNLGMALFGSKFQRPPLFVCHGCETPRRDTEPTDDGRAILCVDCTRKA